MQFIWIVTAALALLSGCATPPPPETQSTEERERRDQDLGTRLSEEFERKVAQKKDADVTVYLRAVAEKLVLATPELKDAPVGVLLIQDRDGKWRNYGLPGNRIYLSVGLLRRVEFENELAAALALELAHVLHRHAVSRVPQDGPGPRPDGVPSTSGSPEFFGPAGIFAYSETERLAAVETAVGVLYRAGFDPRGLVSLWQRYQGAAAESPFEAGTVMRLLERTRQVVARLAPLRNPVVRSDEFVGIQKRIRRL
jgi:predicted Zn-dependent protease